MLLNNTTPLHTSMPRRDRWTHTRPSIDKEALRTHSEGRSWSANHSYRTSYHDMSKKAPPELKNYAVPKYAGFIPGANANSELQKTYTNISRRCFDKEKTF